MVLTCARKAAERRLKAARFPAAKLLDEFNFAARPSVNKPLVLQLAQGDYLETRENVLLVGPSGTGKSHLATAFGMAAFAQGKRARFFRVTELITHLLEAKEERQLQRYRLPLSERLTSNQREMQFSRDFRLVEVVLCQPLSSTC